MRLAGGLHTLPATVQQAVVSKLAARNLLRGRRVGVPAGQDVTVKMGLTPLTDAELGLTDPGWKGEAPLWVSTLKDAELFHSGKRLGPVGGRIVAAALLLGLLALDKTSYLHVPGGYQPEFPPSVTSCWRPGRDGTWGPASPRGP